MTEWEAVAAMYRKRWEEHYAADAESAAWERYEPRYRFAWEMSHDPETQGKSWIMAQPALRATWETRFPDQAWDQAADTVRHGWEHAPEADREAHAA